MSELVRRISLPSPGLQRLNREYYVKDFRFILGEVDYHCPSFIAEFLSPRVTHLRCLDASVQELQLDIEDPKGYFGDIVSLGFGITIELRSGESDFVRSVFTELWNLDGIDSLSEKGGGKTGFDRSYFISRLNLLSRHPTMPRLNQEMDFSMVASHFYEFSVSDCQDFDSLILERILSDPHLVIESEDSLFAIISDHSSRDSSSLSLLEFVRFEYLSPEVMQAAFELICDSFEHFNVSIWRVVGNRLCLRVSPLTSDSRVSMVSVVGFESKIISEFPTTFEGLRGKEFQLLYRGSRDGFASGAFHRKCDNHGQTVTVIQSQGGFVFGGYTPLVWQSTGGYICDESVESFVFTIKNPHGLSPRIFRLKESSKSYAIYCHPDRGPTFGGGHEICVCTHCNSSSQNYTNLNGHYDNDTELAPGVVLVGESNFTVQEIEVFAVSG